MFLMYQAGGGNVSNSSIANDSLVVFQQAGALCDSKLASARFYGPIALDFQS
jgi:hypothetical protein